MTADSKPKGQQTTRRMPTIYDVAKQAGVSIKTVSRVVNAESYIAPATAEKVHQAIAALGYVPNSAARRLAKRKSSILAVIFHNNSWNWISDVHRGAIEARLQTGYEILMSPCDINSRDEQERIVKLLEQASVDGVILTPPCSDNILIIDKLLALKIPFVRISPKSHRDSSPTIRATDRQGAVAVTEHLLRQGHRRIGFILGEQIQLATQERLQGYQQALQQAGVEYQEALVVQGDFSYESGIGAANRLLALAEPPTAIFASNDDMAAGAIVAAGKQGIKVPTDLSVVGFDDIPLARQLWPALTTVRQPTFEMAGLATQLLTQLLAKQTPEQLHYELATQLIVRESTQAL